MLIYLEKSDLCLNLDSVISFDKGKDGLARVQLSAQDYGSYAYRDLKESVAEVQTVIQTAQDSLKNVFHRHAMVPVFNADGSSPEKLINSDLLVLVTSYQVEKVVDLEFSPVVRADEVAAQEARKREVIAAKKGFNAEATYKEGLIKGYYQELTRETPREFYQSYLQALGVAAPKP